MKEFDLQAELKALQEFQKEVAVIKNTSFQITTYNLEHQYIAISANLWIDGHVDELFMHTVSTSSMTASEAIEKIKKELNLE